jgi:hypothetical protein
MGERSGMFPDGCEKPIRRMQNSFRSHRKLSRGRRQAADVYATEERVRELFVNCTILVCRTHLLSPRVDQLGLCERDQPSRRNAKNHGLEM